LILTRENRPNVDRRNRTEDRDFLTQTMLLRRTCQRLPPLMRSIHLSPRRCAKTEPSKDSQPVSQDHRKASFPPSQIPRDNDPKYKHPPSALKAGQIVKGVQILKDTPEIPAMPDEFYPDWLWELFDDPQETAVRKAPRAALERKKQQYVYEKAEEMNALELKLARTKDYPTREHKDWGSWDERNKRMAHSAAIFKAERELEYEYNQIPLDPELNAKYYSEPRREKIKQDNYIKSRGVKG
jgi:Mitochondrial ribosomal protein L37